VTISGSLTEIHGFGIFASRVSNVNESPRISTDTRVRQAETNAYLSIHLRSNGQALIRMARVPVNHIV